MKQRSHRRTRMLGAGWDVLPARPLRTTRLLHVGIERRDAKRTAPDRPMTPEMERILALPSNAPSGPRSHLGTGRAVANPNPIATQGALIGGCVRIRCVRV